MKTSSHFPLLMVTIAALIFVGCERPDHETVDPDRAPEPPEQLTLLVWSEYLPESVVESFEQEYGIAIRVETFNSNRELLEKLKQSPGAYDLIQPGDFMAEQLIREGRIQPYDANLIPNLDNLAPEFTGLPFDPENRYTVPYMAGTIGIVVNTETVDFPIGGYADLFVPELEGRIVVVDDPREIFSWAMLTLGLPINDFHEADLDSAAELLEEWLPLVGVYDSDTPAQALRDGRADVGVIWSGDAASLLQEDEKFLWVPPMEGAYRFVDVLAIPEGAPAPETAAMFIDFILRPDVSADISTTYHYTNPNAAAHALLPSEYLANPASYPPFMELEQLEFFRDIGEAEEKMRTRVRRIRDQD